jgi:DNA modification methylase
MDMENVQNKIILGDCLDVLKTIPDNSVSLIFTSPCYGVGINYDNNSDNMLYQDYLDWLKNIFIECKRVLRVGGRLAINMAITNRQEDKNKEYIRILGKYLGNMMEEIDMLPFAEIIWYKQDSAGKKTSWGSYCSCSTPIIRSTHEFIYVFSKEQYKLEGDIEESDMEPDEFHQWTFSTWFIQPETTRPGNHPVAFPLELAKRVIKLYSYRNDVVLDPFSGSGTTCLAAYLLNRKYIGIDISKKYCDFAENRIEKAKQESEMQLEQKEYILRSERLKRYKKTNKDSDMVDLF